MFFSFITYLYTYDIMKIKTSIILPSIVTISGFIIMSSWVTPIFLQNFFDFIRPMNPVTAFLFTIAGLCSVSLNYIKWYNIKNVTKIVRYFSLLIISISLSVLICNLFNIKSLDVFIIDNKIFKYNHTTRMELLTTFNMFIVGISIILLNIKTYGAIMFGRFLALIMFLLSILVIFFFIYFGPNIFLKGNIIMQIHTTILFLLLSISLLSIKIE